MPFPESQGPNDLDGEGQWPLFSIAAKSIPGCTFGANLVIPPQICDEYRADKLKFTDGWTDGQTDGRTYRRRQWPYTFSLTGQGVTKSCAYFLRSSLPIKPLTWCINSLWSSDIIWWPRSGSTLSQVTACCLTVPSHYLTQCWLIDGFCGNHKLPVPSLYMNDVYEYINTVCRWTSARPSANNDSAVDVIINGLMKLGYFSIHQTITEYLQGWLIIIQTLIMTSTEEIDGLVQERHNSGSLAMELCFSCTNPSRFFEGASGHVVVDKHIQYWHLFYRNGYLK